MKTSLLTGIYEPLSCLGNRVVITMTVSGQWLLVKSKHNAEKKAKTHLELQHCRVILPRYYDRIRDRKFYLYPTYLFVNPPQGQFSFMNSTWGVSHVVRFGEQVAVVHSSVIDAIERATIDDDGLVDFDKPLYKPGQKLRVRCGFLKDKIGSYDGRPSEERVKMLFDIMGRHTSVELPAYSVEAI